MASGNPKLRGGAGRAAPAAKGRMKKAKAPVWAQRAREKMTAEQIAVATDGSVESLAQAMAKIHAQFEQRFLTPTGPRGRPDQQRMVGAVEWKLYQGFTKSMEEVARRTLLVQRQRQDFSIDPYAGLTLLIEQFEEPTLVVGTVQVR